MTGEKLIYFAFRGRGELPRLVLEAAGAKYEYEALSFEQLGARRSEFAFGQLPAYVDGDLHLVQTQAITRYLGRKHKLYGANDKEAALIDVVAEGYVDLITDTFKTIFGPDFDTNSPKFAEGNLTKHLTHLSAILEKNNKGEGFYVGNSLSIADLAAYAVLADFIRPAYPAVLSKFPKLTHLLSHVEAVPNIKAYLASDRRPKVGLPASILPPALKVLSE